MAYFVKGDYSGLAMRELGPFEYIVDARDALDVLADALRAGGYRAVALELVHREERLFERVFIG